MNMLRFPIKSCQNHKIKTLLNIIICMVTVILLNVFAGNLVSIQKHIIRLPQIVKVNAIISNLNGSMDFGLNIKEKYVNGVLSSKYIENPVFSSRLKVGTGEFGVDDYKENLNYYAAVSNDIAGIAGLKEDEFQFVDDRSCRDFFQSEERICVIDEKLMKLWNVSAGDQVTLTSFYYRYGDYHDIHLDPLETGTFQIVGTVNMDEYIGENTKPSVLFPFETVRTIFHEKEIDYGADAGSFSIRDPYELNLFKEEMHDLGFLPVAFNAELHYDGNALTVKDETFTHAADQLLKSQKTLERVLPFLGIAVLCIGFVLAQLLMKGRKPEYAIMRSLGQSHKRSILIFGLEYGFTALIGSLIGIIISIIIHISCLISVLSAVIFIVFYMIGVIMALRSFGKLSIISVLGKND